MFHDKIEYLNTLFIITAIILFAVILIELTLTW